LHDILNKNLQYLERRSQDQANRLKIINPDPFLELITAESGDLTAKKYSQDGSYRFLHSKIDPQEEARIWIDSQRIIMPRLVILGVGLAYHAFELLKKIGNMETAFLIEADERVSRLAMSVNNFSDLLQNSSVHLLIGCPVSVIETTLTASLVSPFSFHIFSPITFLYPDIYNPVIEFIKKHLCELRLSEGDGGIERLLNQMKVT
jgi:hypothetical protein